MNPITTKSVAKLVTQPSFRAVGQTRVEWQTFENPENKRQMYGSQAWIDPKELNRGEALPIDIIEYIIEYISFFSLKETMPLSLIPLP